MCIVLFTNSNNQIIKKDVVSVYCGVLGDHVTIDGNKYYISNVTTENHYQFKCSIITVELSIIEE